MQMTDTDVRRRRQIERNTILVKLEIERKLFIQYMIIYFLKLYWGMCFEVVLGCVFGGRGGERGTAMIMITN